MTENHGNAGGAPDKRSYIIRLLISSSMILGGALVVAITDPTRGIQAMVLQQFGLALMVAGTVSFVHEVLVERFRPKDERCPLMAINQPGIEMVVSERQGHWRYHTWTLVTAPEELFFAGRSVLHRIAADLQARRHYPVEDVLLRKLNEGSRIRVLFCDPTWDLIPALAEQENQPAASLYSDLATSIGIVNRLWQRLKDEDLKGQIEIAVYRELLQYAYHRTGNMGEDPSQIFIGMYFAKRLGCRSPLFAVTDRSIQKEFEDHFETVFRRATMLLTYPTSGQGKHFNVGHYEKCRSFLGEKIGADEVQKRIG